MSGLLGRTPATAPAGAGPLAPAPETVAGRATAADPRDSLLIRLVAFLALGAFGAAHWALLVEDSSGDRMLLVLLVAGAGGASLAMLGRAELPRGAAHALAAIVALVMFGLALMAVGLPGRLLLPAHWSELLDGLDRGLAGVQGVAWPYDGPDEWIRRTILLGAPALLALGTALAFWPARGRRAIRVLRAAGLVMLLLLYGTAVAEYDPGSPMLRGLVLLLLVGAWLWLPRLGEREAAIAAAAVAAVGVLSLPLAAALDGERPWWDYRAWEWFGAGEVVTFEWNHEYGPLDWSRSGATMLNVKSDRPHYWKAETLDAFDGLRWHRTGDQVRTGAQLGFLGAAANRTTWDYYEYNSDWDERIRFTVRSLSTNMVVGAGTVIGVDGIPAESSADGTTRLIRGAELEEGDSYTVRAYAPNPTREQLQGSPAGYAGNLAPYASIELPAPGESATEGVGLQGDAARQALEDARETVFFPLRGEPVTELGESAVAEVQNSPYARMYADAQRLTADAPTAYAAVKNVERFLQESFTYSERVPTRPIPLMGFMYEDERGYCQQFSGAMALMLRMSGIPARVAAGFSPGSFNKDTKEYRVRDLDAHSWVEVWFTGIGWVPFDPTPARSPAQSQSSALATSAAAADAGEVRRQGVAAEISSDTGAVQGSGEDGGSSVVPLLALLLVLGAGAAGALVIAGRVRRVRELEPDEVADVQLSELRRALERLGWDLPASTTLLGLERRLGRFAGPSSEAYARALRAKRYDPRSPAGPGLGQRRALRRELTRGSLLDRVRGLVAIPPGAPRP